MADHVGFPSKYIHALPSTHGDYRKLNYVYTRLEAWRMIYSLSQRGSKPEGSYKNHPKRYLFDMGLLNHLRTQGVPSIHILKTLSAQHRHSLGGIFENYVAFCLTLNKFRLEG